MSILITGGTGLIGSRVAAALLEAGKRVILLDATPDQDRFRYLSERHGSAVSLVLGDVLKVEEIKAAIDGERIETIVHLAYMLGEASVRRVRLSTEVNLVGSANMFELAVQLGVDRVVCASSLSVFGSDGEYNSADLPLSDDADQLVAKGLRLYGASKVYLEAMAATYRENGGPLVVGLRPSVVYGGVTKHGSVNWIYNAISAAAGGRRTTIRNGRAAVSMVHLDDVAQQFVTLVTASRESFTTTHFFNSGGDTCTINEFSSILRDIFPGAQIDVEEGASMDLMGLAASFDGAGIDALVGHPRTLSPLSVGIAKFAADIAEDRARF